MPAHWPLSDMLMAGASEGIKFALGENHSNEEVTLMQCSYANRLLVYVQASIYWRLAGNYNRMTHG
jgi:hypothetical protein